MRLRRFIHLFRLMKIKGVKSPTFVMMFGEKTTVKNIWIHSKGWRFNWE